MLPILGLFKLYQVFCHSPHTFFFLKEVLFVALTDRVVRAFCSLLSLFPRDSQEEKGGCVIQGPKRKLRAEFNLG